jgi:glycine oxidase
MSETSDILVVGGGVIGLSLSYRLGQAGLSVRLVDRGCVGREASWAGAGIIAPPNVHRSDPLYRIHRASLDRYADFCAEVLDASGVDPEYDACGAVDVLTSDLFVEAARSNVERSAEQAGSGERPELVMLSLDEARSMVPGIGGDGVGYTHCRLTAQVRNPRMMRGLRVACEQVGVLIEEGCEVTDVEVSGDRVCGVMTVNGARRAGLTILCAGAWSSDLLPAEMAEQVPVHPVKGQMIALELDRRRFDCVINMGQRYLVPRRDGTVLLGSTSEPEAGFDKRNTAGGLRDLMIDAMVMYPELSEAGVLSSWAGLRPGTPDGRPYVGSVGGADGLMVATGHFRAGLTMAPVVGEIVRDLVVSGESEFDLSWCASGRSRAEG